MFSRLSITAPRMKGILKRLHLDRSTAVLVLAAIGTGLASCAHNKQFVAKDVTLETIHVQLPAGNADIDIYWPDTDEPAPVVIITHGFMRVRQNMAGWGKHLVKAGFVAVIPDLPAWSDHARNSRFITELQAFFVDHEAWKQRIDPTRLGLMGFSAGGLSSLLSAADSPNLALWVGLDPVDVDGMGARAAAMIQVRTIVLTAEPSACNAHGNARDIIAALPNPEHSSVAGAVHVDAEWPTSWIGEFICGCSTEEKRGEFNRLATNALRETLMVPSMSGIQWEH
ncbi:MAG: dienelactone hydrolase family protein [Candidatus Competibacteraceae bacterium]|jgi:dienelactone hydrolase|nr:dienelactone hydrolase family protein [Candidatus Competibacteraceae bacterium]